MFGFGLAARGVANVVTLAARSVQSNGRQSARRGEVTRRTGALAVKVGMMALWDRHGQRHALTVLHVDGCRVVQVKEAEHDGYTALQLGISARKPKHSTNMMKGHFERWNGDEEGERGPYTLLRRLEEFRISPDAMLPVGSSVLAAHFVPGQHVDVQGVSRGKGFQGPMKRHNFKGQPATHGISKVHRSHGSMGASQDPGRVWKGKKMAGRMGGKHRTVQSQIVHKIDTVRNLIYVRGAVPGAKGNFVRVTDAIKKIMPKQYEAGVVPFPTIAFDADLPDELVFDAAAPDEAIAA